jgi:hypothetical protein
MAADSPRHTSSHWNSVDALEQRLSAVGKAGTLAGTFTVDDLLGLRAIARDAIEAARRAEQERDYARRGWEQLLSEQPLLAEIVSDEKRTEGPFAGRAGLTRGDPELPEVIARLKRERDEARAFGEQAAKLYNDGLVLRCAFCGEAYPEGTPATKHDALTAHVLACPKHPMRYVEETVDELVVALDGLKLDEALTFEGNLEAHGFFTVDALNDARTAFNRAKELRHGRK